MAPSRRRALTTRVAAVALGGAISAAFLGPGTVTACASAGARFGPRLLWALLFATLACLVLQDAVARLAAAGRRDLAQALLLGLGGRPLGRILVGFVGAAVVFGCAAYEAGNVLGGAVGVRLLGGPGGRVSALGVGLASLALLQVGRATRLAALLSLLVVAMTGVFVRAALEAPVGPAEGLAGLVVPVLPAGSGWLVVALLGTTVVPYNLYLGSGLASGRDPSHVRFGLAVSILLGGLASMAVLLAGTLVTPPFTFEALGDALEGAAGPVGRFLLGLGLLAAGLTSAVTAPWAAGFAAAGTMRALGATGQWADRAAAIARGSVWACGMAFGLLGAPPVAVIVAAQAANGLVLALVAPAVAKAACDPEAAGGAAVGRAGSWALRACAALCVLLGARQVLSACGWL